MNYRDLLCLDAFTLELAEGRHEARGAIIVQGTYPNLWGPLLPTLDV